MSTAILEHPGEGQGCRQQVSTLGQIHPGAGTGRRRLGKAEAWGQGLSHYYHF
jgi:hypothetical protein